ncbi:dUTP diphosphatase [Vagococcus fessus]|uniref:dUTPase n=1 Tax=Vagococcus fessus TaxID=120370 RepID=A0A430A5C3_9ENTE|nr:dUTP diphosphatase [Vagococcus fessus]RSU01951.1 hypothetical protein CBF31_09290 [Vagococcus fessus]
MNFNKLQPMQRDLDQRILDSKPEMTKEERFTKMLVALSVELAEVANCAEHFKFWKENKGKVDKNRFKFYGLKRINEVNPEPRKMIDNNSDVITVEQAHKLTLVEECADALHFVLSLANQLDMNVEEYAYSNRDFDSSENYFYMKLQYYITELYSDFSIVGATSVNAKHNLKFIITNYLNYIYALGISHEELEQAYYDKHKVNYKRQEDGY